MSSIPRSPTWAMVVAGVTAAVVASTGATVAHASSAGTPVPTADPADALAISHPAAVTEADQQRVAAYWTPERMASAVPIEQLTGDLIGDLPARGTPAVGEPAMVDPTPAAFPHPGGPWTDGGLVATTAGRVFFTLQGQPFFCSGSAVTSANRSTVMTAGHCIKLETFHSDWVFVPGFDNGDAPSGIWTAAEAFIPPQWDATINLNFDFGAMVVNPLDGELLTDVVGAQGISFNQPRSLPMYAFGYPFDDPYDGSRLIYCSGDTFRVPRLHNAIGIGCDMRSGASGGPWFHSFNESDGTGVQGSVVSFGDINFPNTVFGPYFGTQARKLYEQAQSA